MDIWSIGGLVFAAMMLWLSMRSDRKKESAMELHIKQLQMVIEHDRQLFKERIEDEQLVIERAVKLALDELKSATAKAKKPTKKYNSYKRSKYGE